MRRITLVKVVPAAAAVALLTTACLSSNSSGGSTGGGSSSGSSSAGGSSSSSSSSSSAPTSGGKKNISVMFGFGGDQTTGFKQALNAWATPKGITINYLPETNFNQIIATKVQGGNPPDIALFPQPGLLQQYAKQGKLQPLDSFMDTSVLTKSDVNGYLQTGTVNGKMYGAPASMNIKGLVFYDKASWKKAGWKVPQTIDQLNTLTNKIRATGTAPWCLGIESGTATGWPATDWVEELVLKYGGPAQYNDWVAHKIKFESPLVTKAMTEFQSIFATKGNIYGGQSSIASNAFSTALNPLFTPKPGCYMGMQGNFVTQKGFFPDNVFKNLDTTVGFFPFPGVKPGDKTVEGGGDMAAEFTKGDANVDAVMKEITANPQFGATWAKNGSFLSPHKEFKKSNYPDETYKQIATIADTSTQLVFDGSDSMPAAVGTGTFWSGTTSWISGSQNISATEKAIDQSWPSS